MTLGESTDCCTAVRPWLATVLSRVAVTSPSIVGSRSPRWLPYAAAAVCALAQASRVAALFRRPMSTISPRVSRWIRSPRSAGTAAAAEVSAGVTSRIALAGGVHGTCGAGDAPGTPETRGVPTHPPRNPPTASSRPPRRAPVTAWPRRSRPGGRRRRAPSAQRLSDGLYHVCVGGLVAPEPRADPLAPDRERAPRLAGPSRRSAASDASARPSSGRRGRGPHGSSRAGPPAGRRARGRPGRPGAGHWYWRWPCSPAASRRAGRASGGRRSGAGIRRSAPRCGAGPRLRTSRPMRSVNWVVAASMRLPGRTSAAGGSGLTTFNTN